MTASAPAVSIIVPAFRAAATLPMCLDSLLAQTLADIEVLVIDDGSDDGTADVAAAYATRDARVRALRQPENLGVSAARNRGLTEARGAHIGFCDADDWAEPGMYGTLLRAAQTKDAQVSFCAVIKELPGGSVTVPLPWPDGTVFDPSTIRTDLIPNMIACPTDSEQLPVSGYTPRNLFAREALEGLTFRADIHYAEDLLFIVQALLRAQRAVVVGTALYRYRFHAGSTTQRYSPHVPASQYASQSALIDALTRDSIALIWLSDNVVKQELAERLNIRARRSLLTGVINLCLPGSPYPPLRARARAIAELISTPEARALFQPRTVRLWPLLRREPKLALKYALIRYRLAAPLALLYTYFYRSR